MEEKQQFVSLLSSGHFTMSELCKTFGISRKTGHKWRDRHAAHGIGKTAREHDVRDLVELLADVGIHGRELLVPGDQ